jgi:hypothetical protein
MMEELTRDAVGKSLSLHSFQERQEKVCRDFWATLRRFAGQVPFVEDLVAAYYCVMDPATPMRVRGILLAALAFSRAYPSFGLASEDTGTWQLHR